MTGIQLRCNALQTGMITGMQTASELWCNVL
jgi:hypothetical protein